MSPRRLGNAAAVGGVPRGGIAPLPLHRPLQAPAAARRPRALPDLWRPLPLLLRRSRGAVAGLGSLHGSSRLWGSGASETEDVMRCDNGGGGGPAGK